MSTGGVCRDLVSWNVAAGSGDDWTVPENTMI